MKPRARAIWPALLLASLAACAPGRPGVSGQGAAGGPGPSGSGRYEAQQLVGVTDNTLLEAFGPPEQRRREPPAEVWQYRSSRCVVDFYLYRQQPVGLSVVHLEARSPVSGPLPVDSCLTGL